MERPLSLKVLLVDDHPLVIDALRHEVARHDACTVYTATTVREGREVLSRVSPDVLVLRRAATGRQWPQARRGGEDSQPRTACLVLSSFDTPQYVATARRLGAAGYLPKTAASSTIVAAIGTIAA